MDSGVDVSTIPPQLPIYIPNMLTQLSVTPHILPRIILKLRMKHWFPLSLHPQPYIASGTAEILSVPAESTYQNNYRYFSITIL